MVKIAKERNKIATYLNDMFKFNVGMERLFYFVLFFLLMNHIVACLWYFMAKMANLAPSTWVVREGLLDASNFDVSFLQIFTFSSMFLDFIGLLLQ